MGRSANFRRSYWRDFLDFWKSQVFWGVVTAMVIGFIQWMHGTFRTAEWGQILVPYGVMVGLFLVGNVARTIYRSEQRAFAQREHSERRRLVSEIRARNAPVVPEPNIRFRRVYQDSVFVGHEISGGSYPACLVEIGNEAMEGTKVAHARDLRAQLVYKNSETQEVLRTECPAMWKSDNYRCVSIPVGEGSSFVLAIFDRRSMEWRTSLWDGIAMNGSFDVQAKILLPNGDSLGETLNLKFQWSGQYYNSPKFQRA